MVLANPTYNTPLQCIYTVYDYLFGDCPAKIPYIHCILMVLANPTYNTPPQYIHIHRI